MGFLEHLPRAQVEEAFGVGSFGVLKYPTLIFQVPTTSRALGALVPDIVGTWGVRVVKLSNPRPPLNSGEGQFRVVGFGC